MIEVSPRDVVVLDTETLAVLVQARDPDQEPLVFTWIVDDAPPPADDVSTFTGDAEDGIRWTSRLTVRRALVTPDSTIVCLITDSESGARLDWTVVIP